nr:leucine-rich repeat domain-containing protein [Hoylesella pleuritidis]
MFNGLKKLTKLQLPAGTKKIEKYAMSGCTELTECAIPQQVTAIREYAFTQCRKLASLTLPNTVAELGTAAFKECDGLQSVTFTDGISITSIAKDLFAKNVSLTAITFPESVKEIGESAFAGCKSLASATFPSLLEKIGAHAFENCTSLATLSEFPASLSSIEDKAFYNTVVTAFNVSADNEDYLSKDGVLYAGGGISLELYPTGNTSISFEVPKGVADIGENAFAYAKNLKTIKLPEASPPSANRPLPSPVLPS